MTPTRQLYTRDFAQKAHLQRLKLPPVHDLRFTFTRGSMGCDVTHNADPFGALPLLNWPRFGAVDFGDKHGFKVRLATAYKLLELVLRAHKCETLRDETAQLEKGVSSQLAFDFARDFLGSMLTNGHGKRVVCGDEVMDFVFAWAWKRAGGVA